MSDLYVVKSGDMYQLRLTKGHHTISTSGSEEGILNLVVYMLNKYKTPVKIEKLLSKRDFFTYKGNELERKEKEYRERDIVLNKKVEEILTHTMNAMQDTLKKELLKPQAKLISNKILINSNKTDNTTNEIVVSVKRHSLRLHKV